MFNVLQATVQRLIEVRQTSNRNITNELRQVRDYKTPDFLQKMVKHFGVHDKGSCFPKDVFDPDALPKEDFYTACVAATLPADPLNVIWSPHIPACVPAFRGIAGVAICTFSPCILLGIPGFSQFASAMQAKHMCRHLQSA